MDEATINSSLKTAFDHQMNRRFAESEAICRQVLAEHPDHPVALRQLGMTMYVQDKPGDALQLLKRATEVAPDDAESWKRLAEFCTQEKRYYEAAYLWEKVIQMSPPDADNHAHLGMSYAEMDKLPEAEEQYRQAIQIDPNSTAGYVFLGNLLMERGEMEEAEENLRTALRLDPNCAGALGRLAMILGDKMPADEFERAEKRLASPMPASELVGTLFGLARVLDGRGDYPRAASYLREANGLFLQEYGKKHRIPPGEQHVKLVDWTIASFDRDFFSRIAGAGNPSRRPVFVFGLPRSGTTLTEQILASHSQVYGAGELGVSESILGMAPDVAGCADQPLECIRRLDANGIGILADRFLARLDEADGGKNARIVDKMVHNYLRVGFLAALFPNAVLIHCRRDLRDVALSCWSLNLPNLWWTFDVSELALRARQYARIMEHWRTVLPGRMVEVRYESTVEDLEGNARRLIAACGLEWEDQCLDFHKTKRVVHTASLAQVRKPIYKKSVARWKRYEKELADLFGQLPQES